MCVCMCVCAWVCVQAETMCNKDILWHCHINELAKPLCACVCVCVQAENLRKEDIEKSNLALLLIRTQCKQTDEAAKLNAEFIIKQKQVHACCCSTQKGVSHCQKLL